MQSFTGFGEGEFIFQKLLDEHGLTQKKGHITLKAPEGGDYFLICYSECSSECPAHGRNSILVEFRSFELKMFMF